MSLITTATTLSKGGWSEETSDFGFFTNPIYNFNALPFAQYHDTAMDALGNTMIAATTFQVQVYEKTNNVWSLKTTLDPNVSGKHAGLNVSIAISGDGNTIAIGFKQLINNNLNTVRFYYKINNVWVEQRTFTLTIQGSVYFGASVSLNSNGTRLIVGAPRQNIATNKTGSAYIYDRDGAIWRLAAFVVANGTTSDQFGGRVKISGDGNTVAIGSGGDQYSGVGGPVSIFGRVGTVWNFQSILSDAEATSKFGTGMDMISNGNTLVIGDMRPYVYNRVGTTWTKTVRLTNNITDASAMESDLKPFISSDGTKVYCLSSYKNFAYIRNVPSILFYKKQNSSWQDLSSIQSVTTVPVWNANGRGNYIFAASNDGNLMVAGGGFTSPSGPDGRISIYTVNTL